MQRHGLVGLGASELPDGIGYLANEGVPAAENSTAYMVWSVASFAGMGLGAYHGYKRNKSVGWAIGWGLLGAMFPIITIPVSLAQGFGEPAK